MTLLTVLALGLGMTAAAQADPLDGVVSVEILPGWRTQQGTHMAGLRITLAPGWKTYWRAPGDAGIPPGFDWQGSENLAGTAFHWGYSDEVVIPMEFSLTDSHGPARAAGDLQIGVCQDICIPVQLQFDALLPPDGTRDGRIVAAMLDRPRSRDEAQLGPVTCTIEPTAHGLSVTSRVTMPHDAAEAEVVVIEAGDAEVWVSEPESWREGRDLLARADMIHVTGKGFALDRSDMRITVFAANGAVDIQGCAAR